MQFVDRALQQYQIVDRSGNLAPLRLNPPQQAVHARLEKQMAEHGRVRALVLKARREGVSTYVQARFYDRASRRKNQRAMVMAHRDDSSRELFKITETLWENQPAPHQPPRKHHSRQKELVLDDPYNPGALNSSYIVQTAGTNVKAASGVGRGMTLQMAHLSEVAFWQQGKATAVALLQTLEGDGTEAIMETTANGQQGYFYDLWQESQDNPHSEWLPIFLPWWIDPHNSVPLDSKEKKQVRATLNSDEKQLVEQGLPFENNIYQLTVEQIAWRRRKLHTDFGGDLLLFQQEYPATATEAFVSSGSCFFDLPALQHFETAARTNRPQRITVRLQDGAPKGVQVAVDGNGEIRQWEQPEHDVRYAIGVDAAYGHGSNAAHVDEREGSTPHDANAAYVIRCDTKTVVAAYHSYYDPDVYADHLWALGTIYNNALMAVEVNGPGMAVMDGLRRAVPGRRAPYRNLMRQVQIRDAGVKMTQQVGWYTSEQNRAYILSLLQADLRSRNLQLYDLAFVQEARAFQNIREPSGKIKPQAAQGAHDDRVMALAISNWAANWYATRKREDTIFEEDNYGNLATVGELPW